MHRTDNSAKTANGKRIVLIADDYDSAAELMADLVKASTPYDAVSAKDGYEALERAREHRPDVAILDINMPRMGGIEAARVLRSGVGFGYRRPLLIALLMRRPFRACSIMS